MNAGCFAVVVPALLVAGVSVAAAQRPAPAPPPTAPPPAAQPQVAPPSQAPAALSVPNPLAGLKPGPRDLYRSPDGSDRFQHLTQYPPPPVVPGTYFPGPYYYPAYYPAPYYYDTPPLETLANPRYRRDVMPRGGLVLQTIPDMAQVFVDGYYAGLAEEFGLRGRAMDISAGAHRIELRAAGYETLAFSVIVAPNDIVRYRGDMQALSTTPPTVAASQPAASPAARKSFYVIPNCYAGDKPPSAALPKGCDVKKLQTRQ